MLQINIPKNRENNNSKASNDGLYKPVATIIDSINLLFSLFR